MGKPNWLIFQFWRFTAKTWPVPGSPDLHFWKSRQIDVSEWNSGDETQAAIDETWEIYDLKVAGI